MYTMLLLLADANQLKEIDPSPLPGRSPGFAGTPEIQLILGIVFGIIGAIALLIIVIAGLRYITSAGDSQKIANAKNTIIYALVGLAVALTAEAIVAFVIGRL